MFPHAGFCVVAKATSFGCASIPTCKVVDTGNVQKVKVETTQLIITLKVASIEGTRGQTANETVTVMSKVPTSAGFDVTT